ncbi:MAG: Phosphoribosylformylglycinamidine synthase subunit PurQ [Thermoproteota archaeon]|nr:Phosphoribosylformylglycinamidine synthase subunit PurQ [Thermoproteota archaeon]
MVPKVVIPVGYGLNCEDETAYAFEMVGASVDKIFIKDITEKPSVLEDYHILALVGGFSFGDHIAAGKVLANIYKFKLGDEVQRFIEAGKLIFGECNGFQILVKAGILPGFNGDYRTQSVTLVYNDSGRFEDRWVNLKVNQASKCIFTEGLKEVYLPVRHGEGKFVTKDAAILQRLQNGNQIVLQYAKEDYTPTMDYPQNPNGSIEAVAGICDPSGRVFGKMPHSSAYLSPYNHPYWTREKVDRVLHNEGGGVPFFRNAVNYIQREFK